MVMAHERPSVHLEPGEHIVLGVLSGDSIDRVEQKEANGNFSAQLS